MPLWSRLAHRLPLPAVWLAGMLLSIVAFIGAYWLGAGDRATFVLVCVLSGLALGADLAVPPALLARVIDADGASGRAEATYFGLWNFVNKLNLALAAGIALPALQALGYTSGVRSPAALDALALAYALIPCAIKLAAAGLLAWCWQRSRF
jgi:Na+/melibiose symporter-like transporter